MHQAQEWEPHAAGPQFWGGCETFLYCTTNQSSVTLDRATGSAGSLETVPREVASGWMAEVSSVGIWGAGWTPDVKRAID